MRGVRQSSAYPGNENIRIPPINNSHKIQWLKGSQTEWVYLINHLMKKGHILNKHGRLEEPIKIPQLISDHFSKNNGDPVSVESLNTRERDLRKETRSVKTKFLKDVMIPLRNTL